jgi:hypothetical protein
MIKLISGLDESKVGKLDTAISFETDTVADTYQWVLTKPDGGTLDVGSGQGAQVVFTLINVIQQTAENNGSYTITVDPKVERKQGGESDPTMESLGTETYPFSINSPIDDLLIKLKKIIYYLLIPSKTSI